MTYGSSWFFCCMETTQMCGMIEMVVWYTHTHTHITALGYKDCLKVTLDIMKEFSQITKVY